MKVFCEYCGVQVDVNKDFVCPGCGASFENNQAYKKLKEHKRKHEEISMKEREIRLEKEQMTIDIVKGVSRNIADGTIVRNFHAVKKISSTIITVIGISLIAFISFFTIFFMNFRSRSIDNHEKNIPTIKENSIVEVSYPSIAKTEILSVQIDSYQEVKTYKNPMDGYKFVTFHFIIENSSNAPIIGIDNQIDCLVDGIAYSTTVDFDRTSLPSSIKSGLKVNGYITYEVPKTADNYDIKLKYADNDIIIHI